MADKKKQAANKKQRSGFAALSVALWILAAASLCLVLADVYGRGSRLVPAVGFAIPGVVALAMQAGAFLRTPLGLAAMCGGIGLSLMPFALGARGKVAGVLYLGLAFAAAAAAALVWFGNTEMLASLARQLNASPR